MSTIQIGSSPTPTYPTDITAQSQDWPGSIAAMNPAPDHGEQSYTGRDRLTGKRALITGGDSGIGRAVAITFAKEGASVAVAYLEAEEADAQDTKSVIEGQGGTCVLLPTDQRTEQANVELARAAAEALGGIDTLINNAAFQMARIGDITDFPAGSSSRCSPPTSTPRFGGPWPSCRT